ncbi:hypothetical protein [Pseudoclavibacter helvolus]|uniref:Uncharacterized protein n=1 Tax=Pseudoclavibacter helvolus TaxID=255205 RepID=A0A7W4ULS4_9MICO|nr:hypothetical protein [Pseudoclavibacter helvolus]MBB2956811.1 hypothetical protein [Pseudoclavibacter helvolus]
MSDSLVEVPEGSAAVVLTEDELLALAAALDGSGAPGVLGAAIDKVSRGALDTLHAARAGRRAVKR